MANMNTVARLFNLPGPTTVTTETCVASPVGVSNIYGVSTATTPIRAVLAVAPDQYGTPGDSFFDGFPFRIRWCAYAVQPAASTFTVNIYLAVATTPNTNLTTLTSDIKIYTHANTLASKNGLCFGSGILQWNSSTGELAAYYGEGGNCVVTTPVVLTSTMKVGETSPVVATSATSQANLVFYPTFTSSTNAPTSTTLLELALERV